MTESKPVLPEDLLCQIASATIAKDLEAIDLEKPVVV